MNPLFNLLTDDKPRIAILIDPEKNTDVSLFEHHVRVLMSAKPDFFFVGGSTATRQQTENCIRALRLWTRIPVILFPGSSEQFSKNADAILFLSLLSSRNPKYLIEEQINSAYEVFSSGIESISTSYILLDGGTNTSTIRVTESSPIDQSSLTLIHKTALAGTLMGHKALYLDAGSGAAKPVSEEIIRLISRVTELLIVGGGIKTPEAISRAHDAGANIVVIGNHLESEPDFAKEIAAYQKTK
jgi:putative glycerol-1-phosphate prenyltransferase